MAKDAHQGHYNIYTHTHVQTQGHEHSYTRIHTGTHIYHYVGRYQLLMELWMEMLMLMEELAQY